MSVPSKSNGGRAERHYPATLYKRVSGTTGGGSGASIAGSGSSGGGYNGTAGNLTINGGTVTAAGSNGRGAIGSGSSSGSPGGLLDIDPQFPYTGYQWKANTANTDPGSGYTLSSSQEYVRPNAPFHQWVQIVCTP